MKGLVEEGEGHAVVAALTDSPLKQPGGTRKTISVLLATFRFHLKRKRNRQMQRGDVTMEVLGLRFQLVQFFDVLLVLTLQFKRLSATTEKT